MAPAYLPTPDGERLAYEAVAGGSPTVVWLGGFNSDMAGTKAQALADWASAQGRGYVRFDYFGHGQSSGRFVHGTISRWRDDALAVIDSLTSGPLVLVGSSMGGWIATLAALARPERAAGLVLIAPAADMTDKLMEPELDTEARAALASQGVWVRPSPYGPGDPISRVLLEDGRALVGVAGACRLWRAVAGAPGAVRMRTCRGRTLSRWPRPGAERMWCSPWCATATTACPARRISPGWSRRWRA